MAEVRPVAAAELPAVASLVGRAFATDAMITWTIPSPDDGQVAAEAFFRTFHAGSFDEGWIWVVGDDALDGMAMWVPPDPDGRYGRVMQAIDDDVAEIMGERKARYDAFWAWIDEHRPRGPHWYLEHIAVEPERRGTGLGRALIEHGLVRADADGVPAWLVTSKAENVPLYERFGFGIDAEEDAPEGGPLLRFMVRAPG